MRLPKLTYKSGIRTTQQVTFGGLNHTKTAADGEIYDMLNMTSDNYPALSTRLKRNVISTDENVKAVGDRWIIKGRDFIYDGEVKNEHLPLSDTPKKVVEMGGYILIFPDKYYYNVDADTPFYTNNGTPIYELTPYNSSAGPNTITSINFDISLSEVEALQFEGREIIIKNTDKNDNITKTRVAISKVVVNSSSVSFYTDGSFTFGTYNPATGSSTGLKASVILSTHGFGKMEVEGSTKTCTKGTTTDRYDKISWPHAVQSGWRVGDSVHISKGTEAQSVVIEGFEYSTATGYKWSVNYILVAKGSLLYEGKYRVSRDIPDFDSLCSCDNRLWGVCEGTIYASKLGDPKNFYVYQSLSTDSWAVDYLTKHFTAAAVYNGKPTFWTEESVITIHGSTPQTYQAYETELLGVAEIGGDTLSIVDGYLYYLSPNGICVYGGQRPTLLHHPINKKIEGGYGFTDGKKYYIAALTEGDYELYVYDTYARMWHKEDGLNVVGYNFHEGRLRIVTSEGALLMFPPANAGTAEGDITSFVEFADFYNDTGNKKAMSKVNIRCEVDTGARVALKVKYDSANEWQTVKTIEATDKRSIYIPFVPRRCDHYKLRFEGTGAYIIYSISRENYVGSAN